MRVIWSLLVIAAVVIFLGAVVVAIITEPSVGAPLITVIGAIVGFAIRQGLEAREEAKRRLREELGPMAESLANLIRTIGKSGGTPKAQQKTEQAIGAFQDKLLIWGSEPVVRAWANALRTWEREPADPKEVNLAYAAVILEIRNQLGHDDAKLDPRDLLRLYLTDIDKYMEPAA